MNNSFILLIILLFVPIVNSKCLTFQNYYLLGNLTKINGFESDCKDDKENCVYISLNIPAFATGSFHSCSYNVSKILTQIFNKRLDILELFYDIKDNQTNLFDSNYFCNNFNNIVWKGNCMSGEVNIYTYCHSQHVIFNQTSIVTYNPPKSSAIPVSCYSANDEESKECSEGYCSLLQLSYLTEPGDYQQDVSMTTCPYKMYNFLKDLSDDHSLYSSLKIDLQNIGKHCALMDQFEKIVINGTESYYYYIKCYNPLIAGNQLLPKTPIINGTNANSATFCKRKNTIPNNKVNQCPLLLCLIFFKTINDYMKD